MKVNDSDAEFVVPSESLFFNSGAGKGLPRGRWRAPSALLRKLPSESRTRFCGAFPRPLASRLEAALIGLGVGGVSHTEARRHGGFDEQSAARKGEIFSADFITVSP